MVRSGDWMHGRSGKGVTRRSGDYMDQSCTTLEVMDDPVVPVIE
jgi:hypothetical protein